jgi:hypothetical protein
MPPAFRIRTRTEFSIKGVDSGLSGVPDQLLTEQRHRFGYRTARTIASKPFCPVPAKLVYKAIKH